MGFFQFGSLFIFVGQKLTKMTKADIVKQLAQETGVEAVTVLAVASRTDPQGKRFPPRFWYVPD